MTGKIKKLIISDFHLGDGQEEGEFNPWENFYHDEKFAELLRHYSTDYYEDEEFELIINGDFFDLLQVRYDGAFPVEITERIAVTKLKAALEGHPRVVRALRAFLAAPHKSITVLPGNHDFELVFPGCQALFVEALCDAPEDPRLRFIIEEEFYEFDGVQVHHGMQFEHMNRYDWKRKFKTEGVEEPILNQPMGSIFILTVLNKLKEKRPYIDQVQPFKLYLLGAIFFDFTIAMRLIGLAVKTYFIYRILPILRRERKLGRPLGEILKSFFRYSAFPNLERKVKVLLRRAPHIHTVVLGHTHLSKVRRLGHNKTYINTGTWAKLISLDISNLGRNSELTYAVVEYFEDQAQPRVLLRAWQGYRDLWRDVNY